MESRELEQTSSSRPLEERYLDFVWVAHRFHTHLDALREMLNEFVPKLREADVERVSPEALSSIGVLSSAKRAELREVIQEAFDSAEEQTAAGEERPPIEIKTAGIFEGDQHALGRFVENFAHAVSSPRRQEIMLSSLLAMAVGGIEVLVTAIVQLFYVEHPDALDDQNASFTLSDLARFRDIDDAREMLIARKASDIMMGGFDSWSSWLKQRCKADVGALSMDYEAVREIFQRRHVVMHNGGLASHLYVQKVPGSEESEISPGTPLHPDNAYMNTALDHLDVLGTLLVVQAWGTWRRAERDGAAAVLLQRTYRLMMAGRWDAVRQLCAIGKDFRAQGSTKWALACNGWHATLKISGPEAITEDVKEWDTSALAGRFRLVQHVLLGDLESAWRMVPELLEQKEITLGALREWPILEGLRGHSEAQRLLGGENGNSHLRSGDSPCKDEGMDH